MNTSVCNCPIWNTEDKLGKTYGDFMNTLQNRLDDEYLDIFRLLCDTLCSLRHSKLNIKMYLGNSNLVARFITKDRGTQMRFVEMDEKYHIINLWNTFIRGINKNKALCQ